MKKLILISLLALAGCWLQAQTADSTAVAQADTIIVIGDGGIRRGIEFPEKLRDLLEEKKYKEAIAEYVKFRPTIAGDDFLATFSDMDFYRGMSETFPDKAEYREPYEVAKKKLQTTYGKRVEVILMELDELQAPTDQDRFRVYTKVIEADSTYTHAYLERGYILMNEGRMQEACHDFSKHPDYEKMPWKPQCESLLEQEAMEKATQEETKAEEK